MTDALKPCPFCGSDNVKQGGDDKVVGVWCQDCEASGPNGYLTIHGNVDWNTRADLPATVTVRELEWDEHPDGEGFYAFPNDAGGNLYVLDLLDGGRWRLFIGGDLVMNPDDPERVMKWDDPENAKIYAQQDLTGRLRRILSQVNVTPAPVAGWRGMDSAPLDEEIIAVTKDGRKKIIRWVHYREFNQPGFHKWTYIPGDEPAPGDQPVAAKPDAVQIPLKEAEAAIMAIEPHWVDGEDIEDTIDSMKGRMQVALRALKGGE